MRLVSRETALSLVELHLRTGLPVDPRMHDELREAIGQTTPEEEERMRSARLAGEHERERYRQTMKTFADAARRLTGP